MPTTRHDVATVLSMLDPAPLRAVLDAARVNPRGANASPELAARIADALWWHACTPLGYALDRTSFEDLVDRVAHRVGVADRVDSTDDVWQRVCALTHALVHRLGEGVALDDLDPTVRARLGGRWWSTVAWGSGTTGAAGARWGSAKLLAALRSPIGRLLPLIPPLAPWVSAIRRGAGAVHLVSGPLGVALAVLTVNDSLGPDDAVVLPLLLGIGALGPSPMDEASEVAGRHT